MYTKLLYLVSVFLVLSLASTNYGQVVIGDWENEMDGWAIWTGPEPAPEGTTTDYNDTTGVTLNSNSLKLYVPEGGSQQVLYIQLDDEGLVDEFFNNGSLSLDVTRLAEEWAPVYDPNATSGVEVIVNASSDSGEVFENLGGRIWWGPADGNNPRKAIWDYSATKYLIDKDSISYLEFIIVTNFDDVNYPDGGTYYLDNARLLPRTGYFVIGDWENTNDGWNDNETDDPIGPPKYTYVSTGATLNNYAVKVIPDSAWEFNLNLDLEGISYGLVGEGLANNKFSIDVTWVRDEWIGSGVPCSVEPALNEEGVGWVGLGPPDIDTGNPDNPGTWDPDEYPPGTVYTTTMVWDYSSHVPRMTTTVDPPAGYFQIIMTTNFDGAYLAEGNSHGSFYFDNARLIDGPKASNPTPANGSTDAENKPTLTWRPGRYADTHDVYFDTDETKVTDANRTNPLGVLVIEGQDPCSYKPVALEFETTYYWRIDEVNMADKPTTWKGDIWSFTTGNYLVVDNMESYGDATTPGPPPPADSKVWYTWKDGEGWTQPSLVEGNGTGSVVDVKDDPVHGGIQSLGCWYDNDGTNYFNHSDKDYYSEIRADTSHLMAGQDWTKDGVEALTLWFYGDTNNDANATEQMYVKLNGVRKDYDGDMDDIRETSWHEWNIDLAELGIDLTDVTEIAIGFGDENNTTPAGSGVVYFDNIRLYQPRCVLSERPADFAKADYAPIGPSAGDCTIDYQELEIMADDWSLEDDITYTATDPGTNGLFAYYPLDEGDGFTTEDASGNGHDGTLYSGVTWVTPGLMGASAINVDSSSGSMIDIGVLDPTAGTGQITLAIWAKWAGDVPWSLFRPTDKAQGLICKRDDWEADGLMWMFECDTCPPPSVYRRGSFGLRQYVDAGTDVFSEPDILNQYIGEWAHLAATFDGTTARLYLNGEEVASGPFYFGNKPGASMCIGNTTGQAGWGGNCPEAFYGDLDEAYIYNRALDDDEIAWLVNPQGGEVYVPVKSRAELYDAEAEGSRKINLKDFAILANYWLEKQLWP